MSKEICISSTPHETRLAILENDQLTEVYYERENEYTLAGSIYKGRVTRVLPGMQSAFVDLGLERDAFLYVTDFMEEQEDSSDFERIPTSGRQEEGGAQEARPREQGRENQPRHGGGREARAPRAPQVAAEGNGSSRNNTPAPAPAASEAAAPAGEFEDGTRRWRGRRGRRRGFRGAPGAPGPQGGGQQGHQERPVSSRSEEAQPVAFEAPTEEARSRTDSHARGVLFARGVPLKVRRPARPHDTNDREGCDASVEARPTVGISKPSTMVEVPLDWDGAGPLPGESLSRYRGSAETSAAAPVGPARSSAGSCAARGLRRNSPGLGRRCSTREPHASFGSGHRRAGARSACR